MNKVMIDKTYIINLNRKIQRKLDMLLEFKKLGDFGSKMNYTFFDAADGENRDLLSEYHIKQPFWHNHNSGKAMTKGEIGCAVSHYLIWLEIVKLVENKQLRMDSKILILEDDIYFSDNFVNNFQLFMSEINFDYDLLYIGRDPCELDKEVMVTKHIRTVCYSYGAHAYLLTYEGAKKLTQCNYLDNILPTDDFLAIMYGCPGIGAKPYFSKIYQPYDKLKCYSFYPNLVKLSNPFDSDTYTSHSSFCTNKFIFKSELDHSEKEFVVLHYVPKNCLMKTNDPINRFKEYCQIYGFPYNHVIHLADELSQWSTEKLDSTLVLYVPFENTLVISSPTEIIDKFEKLVQSDYNKIIIGTIMAGSTGSTCSTGSINDTMINKSISHPLIGYASALLSFLNGCHHDMVIDHGCKIFQPLSISNKETIQLYPRKSKIFNLVHNTYPSLVYADDDKSKLYLNVIENYTGNNWNEYYGHGRKYTNKNIYYPKIFVVQNITNKIVEIPLIYPKDKLVINLVSTNKLLPKCHYYETTKELLIANINKFLESDCEYYFYIEEKYIVTNDNILNHLMKYNKGIIAPMFKKKNSNWSNFWSDLDETGHDKMPIDYLDIIEYNKKSCWNMPYLTGIYLAKRYVFEGIKFLLDDSYLDVDIQFCQELRKNNILMYVTNMENFGYVN